MTVATILHRPGADGVGAVERVQDVEPILDHNAWLRSQPQSRKSDLRHIATVPFVTLEKWMNEDGCNALGFSNHEFGLYIKRKLFEHSKLRVDR